MGAFFITFCEGEDCLDGWAVAHKPQLDRLRLRTFIGIQTSIIISSVNHNLCEKILSIKTGKKTSIH
jgi:hypothetical protein